MILLDSRFASALSDALDLALTSPAAAAGGRVRIWSFDPPSAREDARRRLAEAGIEAEALSAFKPALHALIFGREAAALRRARRAVLTCPTVPGADPRRFALECHPLLELAPCPVRLASAPPAPADAEGAAIFYELSLDDGPPLRIPAPNAWRVGPGGRRRLSPCAWVLIEDAGGAVVADRALRGGHEAAFRAVLGALEARDWPGPGPHFDRLRLSIAAPMEDVPLPVGSEGIRLAEGLHEDLYFSALEIFARAAGLAPGDRTLTPGAILPEIVRTDGPIRAAVEILDGPDPEDDAEDDAEGAAPLRPAEAAGRQ